VQINLAFDIASRPLRTTLEWCGVLEVEPIRQQNLPLAVEDSVLVGDYTTSKVAMRTGGPITSGGFRGL
jgi:hypothetical protein